MPLSSTKQSDLKALVERRHPEYATTAAHWDFCEATYKGGRDWFDINLFRYHKEGDEEFKNRMKRSYRFNHTREIVDLIQKYIFKSSIARKEGDAPVEIKEFWSNATISGLDIDQFMRLTCNLSSIFGRIWVFVDTNKTDDVRSVADEKAVGARAYAYHVKPRDILDFSIDDDGNYRWMLVRETVRDDVDPTTSSGEVRERFRLWFPDFWVLLSYKKRGMSKIVVVEEEGKNAIGRVPCFPVDHVIGDNRYVAPALINDIAYLDRAVANYLSNLDAIIQDQTFSQLAMPAQNVMPGEEGYDALLKAGTKRVFLYDGENGSKPDFISPDPRQAGIIIEVVNKIINEIYHSVGMAGERTKQDNAVGTDNSSGVAKAYDFERLNSLLVSKSDALENGENTLVNLVLAYHKQKPPKDELVKYPDTFDVRSLYDEFDIADRLSLLDAPDTVRQEQMKQVIEKIFPNIASDIKARMIEDLKDWPKDPIEQAAALADATAPTKFSNSGSSNKATSTIKKNRQGEVTDKTQKKQAA